MTVMPDIDSHHVPVRLDRERWATWRSSRHVLVAVHSVATGQRLLDVLRTLEGDPRIHFMFTRVPDIFSNGVGDFLDRLKVLEVPWRKAVQTRFDLALVSGHEGIHELNSPVMVVQHGASHNKLIPDGRHGRALPVREVYGLGRQWLIRDGAVVPETIVLSHREERARLAKHCPEALPAAEVVGDPCFDRIRASLPLRALYRAALKVSPRQKLIALSSTWGPRALAPRAWDLLHRLCHELPGDRFRIAALLHPNALSAHSEWQIQWWWSQFRQAGLALVSQYSDWCGALASADLVIGDHGSMSLYAAAAGVPVALAEFSDADVDPESPVAELRSLAPRIRANRPVRRQIDKHLAEYEPERYARVVARITSEPGRFARNMRALLYRKLHLRPLGGRPTTEPAGMPVLASGSDLRNVAQ